MVTDPYFSPALDCVNVMRNYYAKQAEINHLHAQSIELSTQMQQQLLEAQRQLQESPEMRLALMFLPQGHPYIPPYDAVYAIWFRLFPGYVGSTPSLPPTPLGPWLLQIFDTDITSSTLDETSRSIIEFVYQDFPTLSHRRYLKAPTFWMRILTTEAFHGTNPLSLEVLYERLRRFDRLLNSDTSTRFIEDHGSIWLDSDHRERQRILLDISSKFPSYLQDELANNYPFAFLDDIALHPAVSSTKSFRRGCENRNSTNHQHHPPTITSVDLKSSDDRLLGTVMKIDNCLSPAFVKQYIESMDQSTYTQDFRYRKHDRGYRFATTHNNHNGDLPSWLMFGEDSSCSLLLSQQTNNAETSFLRVVNYIQHLYTEFMNERMDRIMGPSATMKWGLNDASTGYYDSLMTMVSNPANSNYGLHDDGKIGLCLPDTTTPDGDDIPNKYSKFNMVVPTLAIQNHTKESTDVLFFDRTAPETIIGRLTCNVVTIHLQLIGVQHNCLHKVSSDINIFFSLHSFSVLLLHSHYYSLFFWYRSTLCRLSTTRI